MLSEGYALTTGTYEDHRGCRYYLALILMMVRRVPVDYYARVRPIPGVLSSKAAGST